MKSDWTASNSSQEDIISTMGKKLSLREEGQFTVGAGLGRKPYRAPTSGYEDCLFT